MNKQQKNTVNKSEPQEVTAILIYFCGVGEFRVMDKDRHIIYECKEEAENLQKFTADTYAKIFQSLISKKFLRFIPLELEQVIQMKNGLTIKAGRFYDRKTYEEYTSEEINKIKSLSLEHSGTFLDLYYALMLARAFNDTLAF